MKILILFLLTISAFHRNFITTMENIITTAPYTQYHTMVYSSQIGNYYEIGDSCDIDNIWHFKADHSYELSPGNILCDSLTPPFMVSGTWFLNPSETQLKIIMARDTLSFNMQIGGSNDTLILSSPDSGFASEKMILIR